MVKVYSVLLVVFFLSGCDFMLDNTVPPFFPYVQDEVDLSGALPSTVRDLRFEVVQAGPDRNNPVFVLVIRPDSAGPDRMVLIGQDGSSVVGRKTASDTVHFESSAFVTLDGLVQVGNVAYNPVSGDIEEGRPALRGEYRSIVARDDTRYEVIRVEGRGDAAQVVIEQYDGQFQNRVENTVPILDALVGVDLFPQVWNYFDFGPVVIRDVPLPGGYDYVVNGRNTVRDRWEIWFMAEDGEGSFGEPTRIEGMRASGTAILNTPAGFLGRRGAEGRLVRSDGTSGEVLDRFMHDEGWRFEGSPVAFDPNGEFYLLYDQERRILYKVAPWW